MRICVSGEKASPAHTITLNYGPSIYSRSIGWQLPFPTGPTRFADSPDSRIMKRVIAECVGSKSRLINVALLMRVLSAERLPNLMRWPSYSSWKPVSPWSIVSFTKEACVTKTPH
ncbi:uncharacterized protein CDAR_52921 [Caerostris darwini]|uniref:Uncharacterized protein n=1 Tax=Caerostris darwini TaxID=1538125 RepID=A0AAV4QSV5_9ARAC|nr:uncharacterized protein CDAR_52921 [Caerostris darwini]